MKRNLVLLLSLLMALSVLTGCGAKNETNTEAPAEDGGPAVSGSVIFDHDGVTVTTAGLDGDPTMEDPTPIIWVDVKNEGAQDVYLGVTGGSVNGFVTDVLLTEFLMENGEYYGANNSFGQTVPAGSSVRYALGYYGTNVPGIDLSTLGEMEFCFTTAPDESTWHD